MKYKHFLNLILYYKKISETMSELHDIGFDFFEGKYKLMDDIENIFSTTIKSHYTKEGVDWIEWFIYEADYGEKDFSKIPTYVIDKDGKTQILDKDDIGWGANDENGNPICYSYLSLYEYIEQYKK